MSELIKAALEAGAIPAGYHILEPTPFLRFNNPGDYVTGRLVGKINQKAGSNIVTRYTLKNPDGTMFAFLGSTQLDDMLKHIPMGKSIVVKYDHDEKSSGENKNPMKSYIVMVEDEPQKGQIIT